MIEVKDAGKSYGSTVALAGVDLVAEPGRVTAVVGPNGAGKSTLFRCVLGLERLDQGSALIDGEPFHRARSPLRTAGAAVDPGAFHPGRRAIDEVRIAAASNGIPRREVLRVLDEVGLGGLGRRRVRALSLGMRQRLGLAVALIGRPRTLVLDEPLNGLDVDGIHWVRELLRAAAAAGCAVLISSHVLSELERVSDSVHVLAGGRILPTTDAAGAAPPHVVAVSDDPEELARIVSAHATGIQREGRALLIRGVPLRRVAELAYDAHFFLESLFESRDSLESDYFRLLSEMAEADPALHELPARGWAS